MGFDSGFEDEQCRRSVAVGLDFAAVHRNEIGRFERSGSYVDDEFHQPLRTDIAFARRAEYRNQVAFGKAQFQAGAKFVLCQHSFFKIELHQRFVILSGRFGQDAVQFRRAFHLFGRNIELFADARIAFEFIHLHQQDVDKGVEIRAGVYRILHHDGRYLRCGADRIERSLPRSFLAVELVDYRDDRFVVRAGIAGLDFGTHFEAVLRIDQHDADVGYLESREKAAAEVVSARSVDNVEFVSVVFGEQKRRIDRPLVDVFDVGVVRQRAVGFDRAPAVDYFAVECHRLGQGGLPRARGAE